MEVEPQSEGAIPMETKEAKQARKAASSPGVANKTSEGEQGKLIHNAGEGEQGKLFHNTSEGEQGKLIHNASETKQQKKQERDAID